MESNHIKMLERTGDILLRGKTVGCTSFKYDGGVFY